MQSGETDGAGAGGRAAVSPLGAPGGGVPPPARLNPPSARSAQSSLERTAGMPGREGWILVIRRGYPANEQCNGEMKCIEAFPVHSLRRGFLL